MPEGASVEDGFGLVLGGGVGSAEGIDNASDIVSGFGISVVAVEVAGLAIIGVLGAAIDRRLGLGILEGADDSGGLGGRGPVIGPAMTLGGIDLGAGAGM